jgi:reactive chlorine resistance protein C
MGVGETTVGSRRTNRVLRLVGAAPFIARYGLVVPRR